MKALVIGYGSAGKRHAKHLRGFAVTDIVTYDPDESSGADHDNLVDALNQEPFDIAVVASPPEYHLDHLEILLYSLSRTPYIMCEKPFCGFGFGQLEMAYYILRAHDASRIMIAYNYRFNNTVNDPNMYSKHHEKSWMIYSRQYREKVPAWGFLLDHISHSLDMMNFLNPHPVIVDNSEFIETKHAYHWRVRGRVGEHNFQLYDDVQKEPGLERKVYIRGPYGISNISSNQAMFIDMWESFFKCMKNDLPMKPGLKEAYDTQISIQRAYDIWKHKSHMQDQ